MDTRGLLYAFAAFASWGVLPIYWKLLAAVPAYTILSHRIFWTAITTLLLLWYRGTLSELTAIFRNRRSRIAGIITTLLIATNWFLFIWGINNGHTIECSLGYFISPIVNVLLGLTVLHERISPLQKVAVVFAAAGVAGLTYAYGAFPWLGISLAATFGLYGLLRKQANFTALPGLSFESLILAPLAAYLLFDIPKSAQTSSTWSLLVGAGLVTALPLLWFTEAARRLPLSLLGVMQYLAPTGQFLVGVLVFNEPFTSEKLTAFCLIWFGLILFSADTLRSRGIRH